MVAIIGEKTKAVHEVRRELTRGKIDCKIFTWNEITEDEEFYLILTPPDKNNLKAFYSLTKKAVYLIRYYNITAGEDPVNKKILDLPLSFPVKGLVTIINWIMCKNKYSFDFLKLLFRETDMNIIAIDEDEKITSAISQSDNIIGFPVNELNNRYFPEVFNLKADDIPDSSSEESHVKNLEDAYGKNTSFITYKIPFKELTIPGIPNRSTHLLLLTRIREINQLTEKAERMSAIKSSMIQQRTLELENANEVLQQQTTKLQNALEMLETRNTQMMEELTMASEFQKSLLPKEFPDDLPVNFVHKYIPYLQVGGDFFDIIKLDDDNIGFIITDVSGHGVASALITSMCKSAFDHYAPGNFSPADTLSQINNEFSKSIRTEHYLTGFYIIINTKTMECTYCNAGHPKQLLIRSNGEAVELSTMGFFIGMFEGTKYEDKKMVLESGDKICLFTDGVLEPENSEAVPFGRENIIKTINENSNANLQDISNSLVSNLINYMHEPTFQDDITILLIEIMESL